MEVHRTIYTCYTWVVMHLQQCDSAVVEQICWPKLLLHQQALDQGPSISNRPPWCESMNAWSSYWEHIKVCKQSHLLSFWLLHNCYDSVKVAWKGGNSLLVEIALLGTFCPKGITTNQLMWLCLWQGAEHRSMQLYTGRSIWAETGQRFSG